jgi:hypothetical protein
MHRSFDSTNFSTANYIRLLEIISSNGYEVVDFSTLDPDQKHLLLRHDVDFDLEAAAKLASVEECHGYRATYFVMLSSEFYNPMSEKARDALTSIMSCGHKVGLHFDTSIYRDDPEALSDAAKNECHILEQLTGQKMAAISMHRPPQELVGENTDFAGRLNAYAPRFTREIGYSSDSRGAWHHGSPLENDAFLKGKALQLLTHPIWWMQGDPRSPEQTVMDFLRHRQDFLSKEAERNCTAYRHRPMANKSHD